MDHLQALARAASNAQTLVWLRSAFVTPPCAFCQFVDLPEFEVLHTVINQEVKSTLNLPSGM